MRTLLILLTLSLTSNIALAAKPIVIMLSWDGMRHDFPDRGNYPGLKRLETEGIRANGLTPVYPSMTFPGHVSLATGAQPEVHGIVDNQFLDRDRGKYAYSSDGDWLDAEPLWISSERQGVKSATYFWVGSETDWRGQSASYRMAPFDNTVTESVKVEKIIEWLDLPEPERPQLIMSYWSGADHTAHSYGPESDRVANAIKQQDIELEKLLAAIDQRALWKNTTLILVSDHGMAEVSESAEVTTLVAESEIKAKIYGGGTIQHIFLEDTSQTEALLSQIKQQPNVEAYLGNQLPQSFHFAHPSRTGDIVVTTKPPYTLRKTSGFQDRALAWLSNMMGNKLGGHGYSPNLKDMQGIFFAMGRGVDKTKNLDSVHQLDIAPTVSMLLGIDAPLHASGKKINLMEEE